MCCNTVVEVATEIAAAFSSVPGVRFGPQRFIIVLIDACALRSGQHIDAFVSFPASSGHQCPVIDSRLPPDKAPHCLNDHHIMVTGGRGQGGPPAPTGRSNKARCYAGRLDTEQRCCGRAKTCNRYPLLPHHRPTWLSDEHAAGMVVRSDTWRQ